MAAKFLLRRAGRSFLIQFIARNQNIHFYLTLWELASNGSRDIFKNTGCAFSFERDAGLRLADCQRRQLAPIIQRTASSWLKAGVRSKGFDLPAHCIRDTWGGPAHARARSTILLCHFRYRKPGASIAVRKIKKSSLIKNTFMDRETGETKYCRSGPPSFQLVLHWGPRLSVPLWAVASQIPSIFGMSFSALKNALFIKKSSISHTLFNHVAITLTTIFSGGSSCLHKQDWCKERIIFIFPRVLLLVSVLSSDPDTGEKPCPADEPCHSPSLQANTEAAACRALCTKKRQKIVAPQWAWAHKDVHQRRTPARMGSRKNSPTDLEYILTYFRVLRYST